MNNKNEVQVIYARDESEINETIKKFSDNVPEKYLPDVKLTPMKEDD